MGYNIVVRLLPCDCNLVGITFKSFPCNTGFMGNSAWLLSHKVNSHVHISSHAYFSAQHCSKQIACFVVVFTVCLKLMSMYWYSHLGCVQSLFLCLTVWLLGLLCCFMLFYQLPQIFCWHLCAECAMVFNVWHYFKCSLTCFLTRSCCWFVLWWNIGFMGTSTWLLSQSQDCNEANKIRHNIIKQQKMRWNKIYWLVGIVLSHCIINKSNSVIKSST